MLKMGRKDIIKYLWFSDGGLSKVRLANDESSFVFFAVRGFFITSRGRKADEDIPGDFISRAETISMERAAGKHECAWDRIIRRIHSLKIGIMPT